MVFESRLAVAFGLLAAVATGYTGQDGVASTIQDLAALQDFGVASTPSDILVAAASGGFGVQAESHSQASMSELPTTELEAEVQRTSRVAAFLAQDALVLSKELASLQNSLKGHGRPEIGLDQAAELSALELTATQAPALAPAPAPAPVPAPAPANATNATATASGSSSGADCGGPDQVECSFLNQILTFGYRYSLTWGVVNWGLIAILTCLTFCFCCACCFRRR